VILVAQGGWLQGGFFADLFSDKLGFSTAEKRGAGGISRPKFHCKPNKAAIPLPQILLPPRSGEK